MSSVKSSTVSELGRFDPIPYSRTSGHNLKQQKQTVKSEIRKNSFSNRVVDTWNNLPYDVDNADSVNSFKNKLNIYWKTIANFHGHALSVLSLIKKSMKKSMSTVKAREFPEFGELQLCVIVNR